MFRELFNIYDPERVGTASSGQMISSKLVFEEECMSWFCGATSPDRRRVSFPLAPTMHCSGRKGYVGILTNRRVIIVELDRPFSAFREKATSIIQFAEISRVDVSRHRFCSSLMLETVDGSFKFRGVQKRAADRFIAFARSKGSIR